MLGMHIHDTPRERERERERCDFVNVWNIFQRLNFSQKFREGNAAAQLDFIYEFPGRFSHVRFIYRNYTNGGKAGNSVQSIRGNTRDRE